MSMVCTADRDGRPPDLAQRVPAALPVEVDSCHYSDPRCSEQAEQNLKESLAPGAGELTPP